MSEKNGKPFSKGLMLYLQQHPECTFDDVATWALGWSAASEHYKFQELAFVEKTCKDPAIAIIEEAELIIKLKQQVCDLEAANAALQQEKLTYGRVIDENVAKIADASNKINQIESQKKVLLGYVSKAIGAIASFPPATDGATYLRQLVKLGTEIIESNK